MNSTDTPATATLPTPPAIPASNASYNSIIAKMVTVAKHGPEAVAHLRNSVKGTNTYAKMVRRYADAVIAHLQGPAPMPADLAALPAIPVADGPVQPLDVLAERAAADAAAIPVAPVAPVACIKAARAKRAKAAPGEAKANLPVLAAGLNKMLGTAKPKKAARKAAPRKAKTA